MRKIFVCVPLILLSFLISCSSGIEGTLRRDGSAEIAVQASLQPRTAALIRSFSGSSGGSGAMLIDGEAIGRSMAHIAGVSAVSFHNEGPSAVQGKLNISNIGDFLTFPDTDIPDARSFIQYEQDAGGGSLLFSLDIHTGPRFLVLLSEDIRDYLSALMAPAATGEILGRDEYLELVSSVYGRGVAAEIESAVMDVSFTMPGPVSLVRGGSASGNKAVFAIPVMDILVLDRPLEYHIRWNN